MSYHDNMTLERLVCRCHELLETQSPHTPTNVKAVEAVGSFRTIEVDTGDNEPLVRAATALVDFLEGRDFSESLTLAQQNWLRGLMDRVQENLP